MSLFIDNESQANAPGFYAIDVPPPVVLQGISSGYCGFVFQGEWGPDSVVGEPVSTPEFLDTYFPAGCPRSSTGYRALMRRRLPLRPVRIVGATAAAASATIVGTGGNLVATAKYKGTVGNAITVTIAGAGLTRDITVRLRDAAGRQTEEVYSAVPLPAAGVAVTVDVSRSKLLASMVLAGAMTAFPANGTSTMTTGSNGAVGSAEYEAALALLAARKDVGVVCVDDCGSSARVAVNAALLAHYNVTRDRMVVLQDDVDAAYATVKTTVGALRSPGVIAMGLWAKCLDDDGIERVTPWATFVASALLALLPHESHAWHDDQVSRLYDAVTGYQGPFNPEDPAIQAAAMADGICLPQRRDRGGWALLHDRTTSLTQGKIYATTARLKIYWAKSIRSGTASYQNGPNARSRRKDQVALVRDFMIREVKAGRCEDFAVQDLTNVADRSNAIVRFSLRATTPGVQERTLLLVEAGESVQITDAES